MSDALLTPELLLTLYRQGAFPMVEGGDIYVHDPDPRAIFDLALVRPNARLVRALRASGLTLTMDLAFEAVIRACADRPEQWIDERMVKAYTALHRSGHARSVEAWYQGELVGGIYGVDIGRAFFGESMFSRRTHASKAAFHHLVARLRTEGYLLFDTQYLNPHTRSLGAFEISREEFRKRLRAALRPL